MPDLCHEHRLPGRVAGVDEAGRGPWAGPVVAAAVILDRRLPPALSRGLDDSKKLSKVRREELYAILPDYAAIAVGRAEVAEIDASNILEAAMRAMARAIAALPSPPDHALIDGNRAPAGLPCPATCLVGGDGRSLSIAAASIVAKVSRDREMADLAARFPGYGWERNAGYGTAEHRAALVRLGVTPAHRRSFAPIARMLCPGSAATRHLESKTAV